MHVYMHVNLCRCPTWMRMRDPSHLCFVIKAPPVITVDLDLTLQLKRACVPLHCPFCLAVFECNGRCTLVQGVCRPHPGRGCTEEGTKGVWNEIIHYRFGIISWIDVDRWTDGCRDGWTGTMDDIDDQSQSHRSI